MKTIVNINNIALFRASNGIKKYYNEIYSRLERGVEFTNAFSGSPLRLKEIFAKIDSVFWCPSQSGSVNSRRQIITVHDLISLNYTYANHPLNLLYRKVFQKVLSRSHLVVSISNFTKASILENFKVDPSRIRVIKSPNRVTINSEIGAINNNFFYNDQNFILTVTNSLHHKNNINFIKGFQASELRKQSCRVIFVGHPGKETLAFMEVYGLDYKVLTNVNDAYLDQLYRGCMFYFSSSIIEGHNLTIAEARNAGASVLCSDIAVHREFYDGDAYFFDPNCVDSIKSLIDSRIYLNKLSPPSVVRTFAHVADEYMKLFKRIS
jgi:glycosyltransferase involved in cell wall biosynthesis